MSARGFVLFGAVLMLFGASSWFAVAHDAAWLAVAGFYFIIMLWVSDQVTEVD